MTSTRIAVYVAAILVAVFGVVFVADALVESDEERLEGLETSLTAADPEHRLDRLVGWAGEESVAVVADGRRAWVDAEQGEGALRSAVEDALPELSEPGTELVQHQSVLTGRRGRVTLRLRDADGPIDVSLELALEDERFSLIEVRRMR